MEDHKMINQNVPSGKKECGVKKYGLEQTKFGHGQFENYVLLINF